MAKLTEEMKDFISSNLAWVATIGKDGHVDLGPKMSTFVIDDTHIGYHERTAGQMYRNLLDGSELVIAVANLEQKRGYRSVATSLCIPMMRSTMSRSTWPNITHEEAHDHSRSGDHGDSGLDARGDRRQDHRQGLTPVQRIRLIPSIQTRKRALALPLERRSRARFRFSVKTKRARSKYFRSVMQ